jgi:hypothetical protein
MDNFNLDQTLLQMIRYIGHKVLHLKQCLPLNLLDITKKYSSHHKGTVKTMSNLVIHIQDIHTIKDLSVVIVGVVVGNGVYHK